MIFPDTAVDFWLYNCSEVLKNEPKPPCVEPTTASTPVAGGGGTAAVVVAVPGDSAETVMAAEWLPAAIVVVDGTLATAGFDDESATVVLVTSRSLVSALNDVLFPAVALCDGGVNVSVGTGI